MQNPECRIQNAESRMQNAESRMQNPECRIQNAECRIQNAESRMQNPECRMENACNGRRASEHRRGWVEMTQSRIPEASDGGGNGSDYGGNDNMQNACVVMKVSSIEAGD
jgi:division protein CdvB (Snf7/Vps24/ESCRT-III family)